MLLFLSCLSNVACSTLSTPSHPRLPTCKEYYLPGFQGCFWSNATATRSLRAGDICLKSVFQKRHRYVSGNEGVFTVNNRMLEQYYFLLRYHFSPCLQMLIMARKRCGSDKYSLISLLIGLAKWDRSMLLFRVLEMSRLLRYQKYACSEFRSNLQR